MNRKRRSFTAAFALAAAVTAAACGSVRVDEDDASASADALDAADVSALLVEDPDTVAALESGGFGFSAVFAVDGTSGEALAASPAYAGIADAVDHDLRTVQALDPASGVGVEHGHRLFDPTWLRSPQTRFELVAVVNRLDRMSADAKSCGEVRLVYRLAYTSSRGASRLPMTVNVVYAQADDGASCRTVAKRWLDARPMTAASLTAGPLAGLVLPSPKQIEINFQATRWPSNERPDMGGQAEYILRIFRRGDAGVEVVPLENTPRTDLDDAERAELVTWLKDHVAEIDDGTAIVPSKFLASQATSVAPRGLARMANRPYSQIFGDASTTFGDVDFGSRQLVKSPAALLRRLDTMTCHGCHQARSVAGFHLLGEERDRSARVNALAVGHSPHLGEELGWRSAVLKSVASGSALGKTLRSPRPFAEHGSTGEAGGAYGAHCGLGDEGFSSWTCGAGLRCTNVHGGPVGMCLPAEGKAGDICATVVVTPNADSHHDHVSSQHATSCNPGGENARCVGTDQGFPDGLCRTDCAQGSVGHITGSTICGLIPSASALQECLANHRPFSICLREHNTPSVVRKCSASEACRDDYACARVPNGPATVGACMPPYFAFEARVDGHLFD